MAKEQEPTIIKKYANRRLYNTGTSTYVTLEDLAGMVKSGEDFTVSDAKTGDDITRSVLTQIIFEQENKGQNLLPITFLRQLIRFYGDSIQNLIPTYLDFSIDSLVRWQEMRQEELAPSKASDESRTGNSAAKLVQAAGLALEVLKKHRQSKGEPPMGMLGVNAIDALQEAFRLQRED